MVLHQHEAAELWTKMATDAGGERCNDGCSIERQPAFAPVMDRACRDHQVLHSVGFVTLERRTLRMFCAYHLDLRRHAGFHLAAPTYFSGCVDTLRLRCLLHATRHDGGTTLEALQPRNLVTLRCHERLEFRHFAQKRNDKITKVDRGK